MNAQELISGRAWVIARIEEMLERIVDNLLQEGEPLSITLNSRSGLTRRSTSAQIRATTSPPAPKRVDITFPGATAHEAWKFSEHIDEYI
jgi:meiotic recombination protein SPO11